MTLLDALMINEPSRCPYEHRCDKATRPPAVCQVSKPVSSTHRLSAPGCCTQPTPLCTALGNTSHSSSGTAQWRPSFDLTARASLVPAVNHPGPQDILPFLYATATPGEPRSVLSSIEAFSEHYPMYIVGKEKANLLRAVVAAAAPRLVVEVGGV